MSRKEIVNTKAYQTTKAATIYYNQHYNDSDIDLMDAFEAGANWADKTIIDKACDWLLKGGYFVNNTETINDFKKAMEE